MANADSLEMPTAGKAIASHHNDHFESGISLDARLNLHTVGVEKGYFLEATDMKRILGLADGAMIKVATNGNTVLIPQPTDDPNDPLNWSKAKKNTMLLVFSIISLTADIGASMGIITSLPQAAYVQFMAPVTGNSD